jgi:hypothetical protein
MVSFPSLLVSDNAVGGELSALRFMNSIINLLLKAMYANW